MQDNIDRGNKVQTMQAVEVVTPIAQKAANALQYTGAAVTIIGGLTLTEWAVIVGMFGGAGGFLVNWYYQHKRTKIYEQLLGKKIVRDVGVVDPEEQLGG